MTETTCPNKASHRYTWPGRDESFICAEHVGRLTAVADAMGLHLQCVPLEEAEDERPGCAQRVRS